MNIQQSCIITSISLCLFVPALVGMDSKQLSHFTKEEDVFNVMAGNCPEAIRIIARDILARHPGIVWQEFRDLYTVRHNGQPPFVKATHVMIHTIWKEIWNMRCEALKKLIYESCCLFRPLAKELIQVIESLNNRTKPYKQIPAIRSLIIVNPELLSKNIYIWNEANSLKNVCGHFIASQVNIPIVFQDIRNWREYMWRYKNPEAKPCILQLEILCQHDLDDLLHYSGSFFDELDQLIHSQHFVIIITVDLRLLNRMKNRDGIMVINIERPTAKDRLATLEHLAIRHRCPTEVIQNLNVINDIIPSRLDSTITGKKERLNYSLLGLIMRQADKIFLVDGKFNKDKAQSFFSRNDDFILKDLCLI